ncbi:MAG: hypothetical protein K6G61_01955 [Solobacterium sp.]|nr:hypothetical protein [Solobacterium sp.]
MAGPVLYTKKEKETVRSGIEAVRQVLKNGQTGKKRSLLLCLDRFMDPYYGLRDEILPFHEDLKSLLQEVILEETDPDVVTDAVQLLTDHEDLPFDLLTEGYDSLPAYIREDVFVLLHPQEQKEYRDTGTLYRDLCEVKDLMGDLSFRDGLIFWQLPNGILIDIHINEAAQEGYIGTAYLKNGRKHILAHWHPAAEDVWGDLMDIRDGRVFWAVKKTVFGESLPRIFERREFAKLPEKEKEKYTVLE